MAYVYLTDDAKDDVRDLDNAAKRLVLRAMKKLEDEPEKRGQPLGRRAGSNLTSFRKLVVGDRDHRIVYRTDVMARSPWSGSSGSARTVRCTSWP